jgi:hypothetical protein
MAMEEPHDSVLHDITVSILEESLEVKNRNKKNQENTSSPFSKIKTSTTYKKLMSHIEPLKFRNSNDGRPNKARSDTIADLAGNKDDITQKMESIHHLEEHQQHQEGKSLEECSISSSTTTTTATSDDSFLMNQIVSSNKEGITKMDYGRLNRGTCSSPKDVCVTQNKAIEVNDDFLKLENASYASSGYCVPLPVLEDMEYSNVVAGTVSLIDEEESNEEEKITGSYYHYLPQYDQHRRQLDSLNCTSVCSDPRPDVSDYGGPFRYLVSFYRYDFGNISCWNTTGITDMGRAFYDYNEFNDPLECWDVGQVTAMDGMFDGYRYPDGNFFNQPIGNWNTSKVQNMVFTFFNGVFNQPIGEWDTSKATIMYGMFNGAYSFDQPIDTWDVSQVGDMTYMFSRAYNFNQPIDIWNVSQVYTMQNMFDGANYFNQCLSTWAEKTYDFVDTVYMFRSSSCPDGIDNPNATVGPWCQNYTQGCFAPGSEPSLEPSLEPPLEPSQQPSISPSNKPTDVPTKAPTNAPTNAPTKAPTKVPTNKPTTTTKNQKKKRTSKKSTKKIKKKTKES